MTIPDAPVTRTTRPRVLALLNGNINNPADDASIKYSQLFAAMATQCELVDVCDVELRGFDRYQNALRTIRWPKERWRQAVRKSFWAYARRSYRARQIIQQYRNRADVVFQHGAMFSAALGEHGLPIVLYSDFTFRLAEREDPWRVPFSTQAERERWDNLEMQVYRRASYILTRSEYTRRSMIADYGIDPERVVAVGGGVNFDQLPDSMPLTDAPRILFIGRDFERKGGPELVAAFRRVREHIPNAELWVVTDKADIAGPGIRRITPTHDRVAIMTLYREASVFAMPSRCETWGDVFLEAMAYGLPCVGSTNNAMPEIIQHGVTGYVIAPNDLEELARCLERLLSEPALRQSMGARGRERVLTCFTWERVVQRMLPYLEQAAVEVQSTI